MALRFQDIFKSRSVALFVAYRHQKTLATAARKFCSFSGPAVSGLKQVGESSPRYLEWNLACGVFAQRANHPISVRLPQPRARLTSTGDWLHSFL